jgi:hypothetical protein
MRDQSRVRERALFPTPRIPSELELQARWFAGDFGKHFVSTASDEIELVQFGTWNREAGPDFRDAAIRVNGSEPVRGCIEIDLLDRSWETHGHALNPAFEPQCFTFLLRGAIVNFSPARDRTAMCRRCASIRRLCPRRSLQTFRSRGPADVRRR